MQTERGPVGDTGPTGCFRVLRGGVAGAFIACCLLVLSTAVDKVGVGPGVGILTPEAIHMRFLSVSLLPAALFGFVAGAAVVAGKLTGDGMPRLAGGKPAPDISGIDFRGEALNLSDYRGKVVGLVFWDSWSGPCMREVPHLRKLTERLKDKPFALLGINCNVDKQVAVKAMETERITWPNWHDGGFGSGPIVRRYHIRRYPAVIVLDDNGIVRCKRALGSKLDQAVDELIEDLERKNARK
jgi:thiol-disulfide isomerase/thioredoxin